MSEKSNSNNNLKNKISKELRAKANDFLNNKAKANNLVDIIQHLENAIRSGDILTPALLTLEVVFTELLKRRDIVLSSTKKNDESETETKYRDWIKERYEETLSLMLNAIENCEKTQDSSQALVSSMKLLAAEGKYPIDNIEALHFPRKRLRSIIEKILCETRSQETVIQSFKEYSEYLDVVQYCWNILNVVVKKTGYKNETLALNCLHFINALPLSKSLQDSSKLLIPLSEKASGSELFDYSATRRHINRVWNNIMHWLQPDLPEVVHRQMLIVLLECILPHLEQPVLLTDFLMDSLDCGGAVSLLALQGVFTLIQKHNITYPNIYEKLYSMFEPEIFHTKYKARLFYLADIFLTSTHLPENLVAAFIKRLARLSLISPPQDAIIMMYFIGNLLLRHLGLKKLICATQADEVSKDPYIMEEREPTKSNAIDSSLWEVIALQKHSIPSVATAARFISQPLPKHEWDLSTVLEVKEDDIFDQEIAKKTKQYAMAFERPQTIHLPKNDKFQRHWSLI
ncbi:nucleolar complex protein 4 homolog A [Stomoxys calcitrans]|uniref:CCAAT-binding factor domain-containing protein n=1 Tax=Stomoxys calcitrans TaxID=35570 RepID=A0A1I8QA03_STOCA|nr:nucleolar complex protein 4 homolog A [Stomoxys calcitrans]